MHKTLHFSLLVMLVTKGNTTDYIIYLELSKSIVLYNYKMNSLIVIVNSRRSFLMLSSQYFQRNSC